MNAEQILADEKCCPEDKGNIWNEEARKTFTTLTNMKNMTAGNMAVVTVKGIMEYASQVFDVSALYKKKCDNMQLDSDPESCSESDEEDE